MYYRTKIHFTKAGSFGSSSFEGVESKAAVNAVTQEVDRLWLWTMMFLFGRWNYSSNEIVNSNPVTGSLSTLFNELDSNKENKNTLKATVWENDNWSRFHVHDEMHWDRITAKEDYDLSGDCCFVSPLVIINWKRSLALLAQILCHAAHKMVKNVLMSAWKSLQGFKQFDAEGNTLSVGKKGWISWPTVFSSAFDFCPQQTQTNCV